MQPLPVTKLMGWKSESTAYYLVLCFQHNIYSSGNRDQKQKKIIFKGKLKVHELHHQKKFAKRLDLSIYDEGKSKKKKKKNSEKKTEILHFQVLFHIKNVSEISL